MAAQYKRRNHLNAATDGNVAYDVHTRGNVAYEPEQEPELKRRRTSDDGKRRGHQKGTRVAMRPQQKISVFAIAGFFVVAILAVSVLASYIQLDSVYADTVSAQATLTELESNYAKLKAEDEEIFDSETLRKAAEEAGLSKPTASQKVYLELSEPNNAVVYQKEEKATGLQGCWKAVKSFFGGIGAYFS